MDRTQIFESMPVPKAYFKLTIPLVLGNIISLIYNMVDTYFIAGTGNTSLVAGVSLCAPMITLLVALGDIFALGGASLISRFMGEKRDKEARNASCFCFYAGMAVGLISALLLAVFSDGMLGLLGAEGETFTYAKQYYMWLMLGAPLLVFHLVPLNILRTEGMAKEATVACITGSVLNIILDPIFIYTLKMGAAGAAIATDLGYVATDIIMVYYILFKSKKLSMAPKDIYVSGETVKMILAIGIPGAVTNLMATLASTLTNRHLAVFGAEALAAMGIAMKVNMIVIMIMVGFVFGAQPLIGYNYGAKNKERLKEIVRFDILVQLVFSVSAIIIFSLTAPMIMKGFMDNENVISYGSTMLRCILLATPFAGIVMVFTTIFQSEGKAMPAFLLSFCRQGVIFAVCLLILDKIAGYYGILFTPLAADALTAVLAVVLQKREKMQ